MISPRTVKLIKCLPKGFVEKVSRRLLRYYINKYADIELKGFENLNNIKKPILFICNHLSNSDALVINKVLEDQDLTFVAGIKLSNNPLTSLGISMTKTITIRPNTADKEAISNIIKTLKNGDNIFMFPEGTRSRTGSMIEGKKGIVLIQKLSKATIVPVGLWGTEKLLPISQDMGAESFCYAKVHVNVGEGITLPEKLKDEERHEYEDRATIYAMRKIAELLPEEYRGVYR